MEHEIDRQQADESVARYSLQDLVARQIEPGKKMGQRQCTVAHGAPIGIVPAHFDHCQRRIAQQLGPRNVALSSAEFDSQYRLCGGHTRRCQKQRAERKKRKKPGYQSQAAIAKPAADNATSAPAAKTPRDIPAKATA